MHRRVLSGGDLACGPLAGTEPSVLDPQVQFKPPLSAREAQFLQDISADRPPGY